MRERVCLAVIYKKMLLVVKRRGRLVLPRKQPEQKELDIDCIFRVIKEIPGLKLKDLVPLGKFNGRNFLQWSSIKDKIYIAKAEKEFFNISFEKNNSIKWIKNLEKYKFSKRTRRIFWILKSEGYL